MIQLVLQCQNLNDSIVAYNDTFGTILERQARLNEKYIKTTKTPWSNIECQHARKKVFQKAFEKNKFLENKSKYNAACKHANEVNGIERENYFKEKLANHKGNSKATNNENPL